MSDYLSTLAARSLSLVPVATPRLAAWFEPAAPAAGSIAVPPAPAAEPPPEPSPLRVTALPVIGEPPRAHDPRPPAVPGLAPLSAPATRLQDEAADRPRAPVVRATDDRTTQPLSSRDAAPATQGSHSPASAPASTAPRSESPPPSSSARELERESSARIDPRPAQTARLDEVLIRLTQDRLTSLERRAAQHADHERPVTGQREASPMPLRPPDAREPSAIKRPVRVASDAPASETQAPIVRVTIGRIEVRAVMPPPPAPLPKPAPPSPSGAISLDEYLKQRSGAGR